MPKKNYKVEGTLVFEKARIIFRNFAGEQTKYNPAGRRSFCVLLDPAEASRLEQTGWNIKWLDPREEGDLPQAFMQVIVKYREGSRPPKIVLISSTKKKTFLDQKSIDVLDWAELENVDILINPYNWSVNGKEGVAAYLKTMYVTIREDELDRKYSPIFDTEDNFVDDGET